jgi:LPS O-antigen subunit length determinant protein (WzzB/FepE family)
LEEKDINKSITKALYKARYKVIFTTLLFFVASIVITYFIPKKYVAFGVVYPTQSNIMTEVEKNPQFGFDIHADRLIQLFESDRIKQRIVEEFDLINYYDLDTNSAGWKYSLNKNFSTDITFNRTRYLSVAIQANMKDAHMSANIVNRLIELIDTVRKDIFITNSQILFDRYEENLKKQEVIVDKLLIQLYENNNGASNSDILAINRLKQLNKRDEDGEFVLADELVKDYLESNYTLRKETLLNDYYHEVGIYNSIRSKHAELKSRMELPFPSVYKIIAAEADEKKVSPSYFVNGIIGLLLGFVLSITLVVLGARFKEIINSLKD